MAGVGGDLLGYNLFAYCQNDPVNMVDPTGNWPKWLKTTLDWISEKYKEWKEESFVYNVVIENIALDAGVGIGIGGEIELGKLQVSAIARADMIGVETNGFDAKVGHFGKSAWGVGVSDFSIGVEGRTYESFDGRINERYNNVPEIGWSLGGEIGIGLAAHASVSVSFSGIVKDFYSYGKGRDWWK